MEKIGLIAGNRRFPLLFAESARKKGYSVVAIAIRGDTSPALRKYVDRMHWLNLRDFDRLANIFKKEGVAKVVMAGQISPWRLFSREVAGSASLQHILMSIKDKRADSVFGAIADRLKDKGLELLDSTTFIGEHLPQKGLLTAQEPGNLIDDDIHFAFMLAKQIAALDIGQSVAVKDKAILAVEALEGTDNLIKRAGKLCRGGFTVAKVSKPKQDMRFDIPVVGLNTIKNLIKAKAKCLAIEADKTLFIDREKALALANKQGLIITAV
ncbi:MAG: UDP-2,3-diacylglucosamine diphosphatase LpxI [Candidatus Omnitrophica bacterium]|nr:UDP-2,3-diacylglucosamine diphosphatase LpxI [Candidatus Omnitrophota bacterium]